MTNSSVLIIDSEDATRRPGSAGLRHWVLRAAPSFAGIATLLAVWALGGWLIERNPATTAFSGFAPRPALFRLYAMILDGSATAAITPSLGRVASGLAIAIAIGAPIGVAVGRSALFRATTHVPFQFLRMISPLSWMPIAILAFPTWNGAIIFLIVAASIWPIVFATASGLAKLDPDWFKLAHNLGAGFWRIVASVIVPAIAQDILTGVRLALGIAWIVLVPAEYLGVTSGLGYAINDARDTLEYDRLAALVVIIGLIGFSLDSFFLALISRVSWTRHD